MRSRPHRHQYMPDRTIVLLLNRHLLHRFCGVLPRKEAAATEGIVTHCAGQTATEHGRIGVEANALLRFPFRPVHESAVYQLAEAASLHGMLRRTYLPNRCCPHSFRLLGNSELQLRTYRRVVGERCRIDGAVWVAVVTANRIDACGKYEVHSNTCCAAMPDLRPASDRQRVTDIEERVIGRAAAQFEHILVGAAAFTVVQVASNDRGPLPRIRMPRHHVIEHLAHLAPPAVLYFVVEVRVVDVQAGRRIPSPEATPSEASWMSALHA